MAPFLGTYFNPEIGTIAIQAVDDKLMLHSEGLTAELSQFIGQEDGVFFISDIPRVTIPALRFKFRTDSNGKPILTVYEEDVLEPYSFERMDTPQRHPH